MLGEGLSTESLVPRAQRQGLRRDIAEMDEMDEMIQLTLDALGGASQAEAMAPLEPQALVAALVEDQRACGQPVSWAGRAQPLALRNAPDHLCIEVQDAGPGLPAAELTRVLGAVLSPGVVAQPPPRRIAVAAQRPDGRLAGTPDAGKGRTLTPPEARQGGKA